jgi:hypothetical protein
VASLSATNDDDDHHHQQAQKEWGRPENLEKRVATLKKFLELINDDANVKEGARRCVHVCEHTHDTRHTHGTQ